MEAVYGLFKVPLTITKILELPQRIRAVRKNLFRTRTNKYLVAAKAAPGYSRDANTRFTGGAPWTVSPN